MSGLAPGRGNSFAAPNGPGSPPRACTPSDRLEMPLLPHRSFVYPSGSSIYRFCDVTVHLPRVAERGEKASTGRDTRKTPDGSERRTATRLAANRMARCPAEPSQRRCSRRWHPPQRLAHKVDDFSVRNPHS